MGLESNKPESRWVGVGVFDPGFNPGFNKNPRKQQKSAESESKSEVCGFRVFDLVVKQEGPEVKLNIQV